MCFKSDHLTGNDPDFDDPQSHQKARVDLIRPFQF